MNFNLLPNEILLTFFDYLNGNDLLHTFYGLNARINALLYNQYRRYYVDFSLLSKRSFDLICQQHIPLIAHHILVLHLSDSESTPGQISLFFSYRPSLRQFTHLRLLSFTHLRSKEILLNVAIELPHLVQLTHLKFKSCSISDYDETDFELLMNNIWSLPNLIHFYLYIHKESGQLFIIPSKISSSLKYLSINTEKLNWNLINQLFQCTPYLKYFHGNVDCLKDGGDYITSSFSSLTNLKISIIASHPSTIISFLRNIPNLLHLNIGIACPNFIDGYQWEDLIRNYLPKLKTFHLSMTNLQFIRLMTEEEIDELMNSFRSSFWIDEHQWFVRCIGDKVSIDFETVSNAFYYSSDKLPSVFKSTDSQDNMERLYTSMRSISDETLFDRPISSKICFPNIDSLSVKCPINDQYWSMVSNLHQVSSLSLRFTTNFSQSELQTFLNRMPHLRSLTIRQNASLPLSMSLFNCTFPSSIHYLHLEYCRHYFNEEDCFILSHSSLTSQCKQLNILVTNRESIIILVKNMPNLCTLCARCTDNEDIQWLTDHLPPTCAISRHPSFVNQIRIWIR
ncbi:unnamed protein product [Adineta steineri]|uniref:F-box domain-containing protein n=2 Tax=Adineta steineri TaxID=433720 RepID=A0A815PAD1_9BILA|nr:unnamed protein product [Adineta steineri]